MNIYKTPNGSFINLDVIVFIGPVSYTEYQTGCECPIQFALIEKPTMVWLAGRANGYYEAGPKKKEQMTTAMGRRAEKERLKIVKAFSGIKIK